MYAMHYASMLQYWQLVRILVRINHPCLMVGCHNNRNEQYLEPAFYTLIEK
jgi:hypothetical protein